MPLLGLHADGFTQALTRLTERPLLHPVHGAKRYRRAELLQHLERVRSMRLDTLVSDADKYRYDRPAPARPPVARVRPARKLPPIIDKSQLVGARR